MLDQLLNVSYAFRFNDSREAREIKFEMDRTRLGGREIAVLFAQQKRKTPDQMRALMTPASYVSVWYLVVPRRW